MQQRFPVNTLQSSSQVLFIINLSIRDLIYLQTYLTEFVKVYSNTKVSLLIMVPHYFLFPSNNALLQAKFAQNILSQKTFIDKVYLELGGTKKAIALAMKEEYQAIFLLDRKQLIQNIKFAKKLNRSGFLFSTAKNTKWYNFFTKTAYKKLTDKLHISPVDCKNPSAFYSTVFSHLTENTLNLGPIINIPKKWVIYAKLRFLKWGIDKRGKEFGRVFFINTFDDLGNHAYPLKSLLKSVWQLKQNDEWNDVNFILNVPPKRFYQVKTFFAENSVNNLFLLSADYDFFQIPAILGLCDSVFSVNGFCIDLANALNVKSFDLNELNTINTNV